MYYLESVERGAETMHEAGGGAGAPVVEYRAGEQIAGRYEVLGVLGRGGSGVVYRVLDRSIQEEIAVKIIADPEGGLERLRQEVRLSRRVTHPNVCRVFDIVEHRHGALLSMELATGGTLADRLGRAHDEAAVRALAVPILAALAAAHAAGVVHRDLKPANVLVHADGRVMLSDFGVARATVPVLSTNDDARAGTPAYMAPEQLRGRPVVDERADLYALGLILYELLVGRLPFVEEGQAPTLAAALRRADEDVPSAGPGPLARGVARLLEREPSRRPASVAEAGPVLGLEERVPGPAPWRRGGWIAGGAATLAAAGLALWVGGRVGPSPGSGGARVPPGALETPAPAPAPGRPAVVRRSLSLGEEAILEPPAFTPDGSSVIVSTNRTGVFELWALDAATGAARQLTSGRRGKHFPRVAGAWLYYLVEAPRGHDVVRVPLAALARAPWGDGAELVRAGVGFADVAPGGAVLTGDEPLGFLGLRSLLVQVPGAATPVRIDARGGRLRWAYLSPDGTRVAWIRTDAPYEPGASLWIADAASGESRRLTGDLVGGTGMAWTPDGREVAFFRDGAGDGADARDAAARALVAIDVDSRAERTLVVDARDGTTPVFSPGGRLSFVVDSVDWGLWLRAPDGPLRRLTFLVGESATYPTWLPARGELVYLAQRRAVPRFEARRVAGADHSRVTARRVLPEGLSSSIAVSPDGRLLLYALERDGESRLELAVLDEPTSPPITLLVAPAPSTLMAPQFLGDGRIAFVRADGAGAPSLWDARADGTGARLLVERAGGGFRSSDGRWLAYSRGGGGATGVFVQRLDARGLPVGAPRPVPGERALEGMRFDPGSGELLGMDGDGLWAIEPANGRRRRLADWPPGTRDFDRAVGGPGGSVYCSLGVGRAEVVLIDGALGVPGN